MGDRRRPGEDAQVGLAVRLDGRLSARVGDELLRIRARPRVRRRALLDDGGLADGGSAQRGDDVVGKKHGRCCTAENEKKRR